MKADFHMLSSVVMVVFNKAKGPKAYCHQAVDQRFDKDKVPNPKIQGKGAKASGLTFSKCPKCGGIMWRLLKGYGCLLWMW